METMRARRNRDGPSWAILNSKSPDRIVPFAKTTGFREVWMANQMFAKRSLKDLLDEMAGDHRLKRVLGPVTLTSLGIGAVIGAGIFVATGAAARSVAG